MSVSSSLPFIQQNLAMAQIDTYNSTSSSNTTSKTNTTTAAKTVIIAKGAANPTVDLTLQKVGQWYTPKKVTISVGDTITWKNQNTDVHTVTSGLGAGIQSAQTSEKGKPDGIFDSGPIKPGGGSWSHAFYNPDTYNYFCTIHPWMEGVVVVNPVKASEIPNYPVDAFGHRQNTWPIYVYTKDGKYEVGLQWNPVPILTGKTVTFIADFFEARTNAPLHLKPYDFVVVQNGKELDRVTELAQIGSAVHKYIFSRAGPITIRVENVGDDGKNAYSEFSAIVYPNPNATAVVANQVPGSNNNSSDITRITEGGTPPVSRLLNPLTLVWITYGVIFGLPAAAAIVILFKKGII